MFARPIDELEIAVHATGAPGQLAAVAQTDLCRIARLFGKLQGSLEALLRRQRTIGRHGLQRSPPGCIAVHELLAGLVLFDGACLSHYSFLPSPLGPKRHRSEEHTSELQSLMRISYAVFCMKKKTRHINIIIQPHITK